MCHETSAAGVLEDAGKGGTLCGKVWNDFRNASICDGHLSTDAPVMMKITMKVVPARSGVDGT